jgi:tetratricopeptide (TPR) repeat protein
MCSLGAGTGLTLALVALSLVCPNDAFAQREQVVRVLADLHATLEGPYGDEGAEVSHRFDELSRALAGWDRPIPAATSVDPDSAVAAYLAITRAIDGADLTRARDTLLRAVQGAIRGAGTRPLSPFPPPAGAVDESGGTAPRFPLARYADAFERATQGQTDEAIARLKEAAANDPLVVDPASRSEGMQQAAASLRRGSLRDAIAALEKALKASPGSSEAHRMLGTALGLAGDFRGSVEHFEAAVRIRPDDERSWIALANAYVEGGSLVDATRTLEKAIAAIPGSGGLRWRLAGLLVRLEQVGDALTQYAEAARLTPVSGRAAVHQAVATAATLQHDVVRAAAAGEQRVRANLNDAAAHRDLASVYLKQGRQNEAFAELAVAAWLDPDDALTLVTLGHSLMADHRDEDAVAALERAVSLQPNLRDARYALAQALTRASRRAEAERHLLEFERQRAEAVAREERVSDIESAKGEAARKSAAGLQIQAIDDWKQVIAREPHVAKNYLDMAEALVKAGRLAESLPYFVKTSEMDGVAEVHRRLADVLARLGRARESALARETYERLRLEDFRRRSSR